jgi:antitoxin MazE
MLTKIMPWGNSQGLRIPKAVLDLAKIGKNAEVELVPQERTIIIKLPEAKNRTLEDVFAEWDGEYPISDEIRKWEQMPPVGRELL